MTLTQLRQLCLSLPGATEQIQWGKDLVFKVGGKMFCVACTEPEGADILTSFKCDPETFAELTERDGIVPAPYLARAKWVGLERWDALEGREYRALVPRAYEIVRSALPKKTQASLLQSRVSRSRKP
jgi:predicted DNA-binding protein (MmcQ/YjbR family)